MKKLKIYRFGLALGFILSFTRIGICDFPDRDYVIVKPFKTYQSALEAAKKLATDANIRLDLRKLLPDSHLGLRSPLEECRAVNAADRCYIDRFGSEQWGYGEFISVEYDDYYEHQYYFLVVNGGPKESQDVRSTLRKVKRVNRNARLEKFRAPSGAVQPAAAPDASRR